MGQYINKSVVLAEIKRLKVHSEEAVQEFGREGYMDNVLFEQSKIRICETFLSFLDTLEVEEVDLEKNINDYFKDWKFDDELDIMVKPNNYSASFTDLKEIAKHFFELGIKAVQKGD